MEIRDTCIFVSPTMTDSGFAGHSGSLSAEVVYNAAPFKLTFGTRGDYWSIIDDYGISPRIGLSVNLSRFGIVTASSGLYYQFPSKFNEIMVDILTANDGLHYQLKDLYAQRCRQAVLGYELPFAHNNTASIELYSKWYD